MTAALAQALRDLASTTLAGSILTEAAHLLDTYEDDCASLGEEIEKLREELGAAENACERLSCYLVSIGLPANPVTTEGLSPELAALIEALHG